MNGTEDFPQCLHILGVADVVEMREQALHKAR